MFHFLDRSRSVAGPGYSRWLVPPAALCIHLSIGQAYAWSVFNIPLTRVLGVSAPAPGDWTRESVIWIFSLAIVCLGLSAAFGGKWLEAVGPRKAMFVSALCFSGGFFIAALGVSLHAIWLLYLGYGLVGGCGLGLGYISPVGTLIRWFPDRPGMATGMAIMGFGGGAMIAAPLSVALMKAFQTEATNGVWQTFVVLGILYGILMLVGAFTVRVPPPGWQPAGFVPSPATGSKMVTTRNVHADVAIRTPQFYLLWVMLCLNVTAGIGILGKASDMVQDMFGVSVAEGSWFVGILSAANMGGRFLWSTLSDFLGRKATYAIYFGLGLLLYGLLPTLGKSGWLPVFIATSVVIMTMYGGAFATIPAYLRDLFGTMHVGAIHGRLLTAWSTAGVLGPVLLTRWAERQKAAGVPPAESYSQVLYFMSVLLLVGFLANLWLSPVDARYHHPESGGS
ncbi:MAG: OFA family MFS transporter [Planctomycetaceae bacterium]|jgi:MFS family permease